MKMYTTTIFSFIKNSYFFSQQFCSHAASNELEQSFSIRTVTFFRENAARLNIRNDDPRLFLTTVVPELNAKFKKLLRKVLIAMLEKAGSKATKKSLQKCSWERLFSSLNVEALIQFLDILLSLFLFDPAFRTNFLKVFCELKETKSCFIFDCWSWELQSYYNFGQLRTFAVFVNVVAAYSAFVGIKDVEILNIFVKQVFKRLTPEMCFRINSILKSRYDFHISTLADFEGDLNQAGRRAAIIYAEALLECLKYWEESRKTEALSIVIRVCAYKRLEGRRVERYFAKVLQVFKEHYPNELDCLIS